MGPGLGQRIARRKKPTMIGPRRSKGEEREGNPRCDNSRTYRLEHLLRVISGNLKIADPKDAPSNLGTQCQMPHQGNPGPSGNSGIYEDLHEAPSLASFTRSAATGPTHASSASDRHRMAFNAGAVLL